MHFFSLIKAAICKIITFVVVRLSKLLPAQGCVYMLHSIGDERHPLNISNGAFEQLLVKIHADNIIRLENILGSKNYFCLSFDDLSDSFYYNAFPLLKKYRIPFTIFVSCSLLDKKLYLTSEMLIEIASCDLCTLGSHGWEHVYYRTFDRNAALNDLIESKKHLETITNRKVDLFAFPFGSLSACGFRNKRLVNKVYKMGFGTIATSITKPNLFPSYFLPRVCITEKYIDKIKILGS